MTPLAICAPPFTIYTPSTPHRFDKPVNLLNVVKSYIFSNISKRLETIEHAWQEPSDLWDLVKITKSFVEWVKSDLKGDMDFIGNELLTFSQNLDLLSDLQK